MEAEGSLMSPESIEQTLASLEYDGDDRRAPDDRRRGQFRTGWEDSTKRGELYADSTLKRLTWHNLGYRFGKVYGDQTQERIDATFEVLAVLWKQVWEPSNEQNQSASPSPQQYMLAFRKVDNITDSQIQMLRLHYHTPARTITASQMA
jgi:5-methylcytosine-specific restriction protein A